MTMTKLVLDLILGVCTLPVSQGLPAYQIQAEQMKCTHAVLECVQRRRPIALADLNDVYECID